MDRLKGMLYAAVSSSTFGLAPFFTLLLLGAGYSFFEVLSYRWGIAFCSLFLLGGITGRSFRLGKKDWITILILSLFRAITSLSLVIAYQNIASGVASTIHFMYPLAVTIAMMLFFHEKKSGWVITAIFLSIIGAVLLSSGNIDYNQGNIILGISSAVISIFSYGGYIVGVRKSRAVHIDSTILTCYVTGIGAILFVICGCLTTGIRIETDFKIWLYILGLALPATALSNITLVKAIKYIGPTFTAILGALEPLTAVVIGVIVFHEMFTLKGALGILGILIAVAIVILHKERK